MLCSHVDAAASVSSNDGIVLMAHELEGKRTISSLTLAISITLACQHYLSHAAGSSENKL